MKTPALRSLLKAAVFFLTLVGAMVLVRIFDLHGVLDPAWADARLRSETQGAFLYTALVMLLSPLGVPRQALAALGGYAFGAFQGTILACAGLVGGCAAGFFYARLLARSMVRRKLGKRIHRLDAFLSRNPFAMAAAVRCFPLGNNALTNMAAGLTSIPPLPFFAGSALGYLPQTVTFALLGSGIRVDPLWNAALAALLFTVAAVVGIVVYKRCKGAEAVKDDED
ncbi:MAG: VTT domain-containing protein [Desulfovibrio sp.]|nr:VTT domain-containing protein [Desulfovibrio sp.]